MELAAINSDDEGGRWESCELAIRGLDLDADGTKALAYDRTLAVSPMRTRSGFLRIMSSGLKASEYMYHESTVQCFLILDTELLAGVSRVMFDARQ